MNTSPYTKYSIKYSIRQILICLSLIAGSISCKKLVEVPQPPNATTTAKVFARDDQANSAVVGLYYQISTGYSANFATGMITVLTGLSADELIINDQTNLQYVQFQKNSLTSDNPVSFGQLWTPAYSYINGCNAILAGIASSTTMSDSAKKQLTGEAKFLRAFCYFYLVNLFGDVPEPLTSNWLKTNLLSRTAAGDIYTQMESDLKDAQTALPGDFSVSGGQRTRANKYAATALLSRVYLYEKEWANAISQTDSLLENNPAFSLQDSLKNVFLTNSTEAILQWQQNTASYPFNGLFEGLLFIPIIQNLPPAYYLTDQLTNAFEAGDRRDTVWVKSKNVGGTNYYYPDKYTTSSAQISAGAPSTQYYCVLRLAEQYLIRAEARANNNDLTGATEDLNMIRRRAGLTDLSDTLDKDALISAVAQERRVELFAEWGHRWLDLKRTGQAATALSPIKTNWSTHDAVYPIPLPELTTDPNLSQNTGY